MRVLDSNLKIAVVPDSAVFSCIDFGEFAAAEGRVYIVIYGLMRTILPPYSGFGE